MIISVIGLALFVWAAYSLYKISKYEFENRSEGGVVGFKSFNSAIGHRAKRGFFVAIFFISMLMFCIPIIIWFHYH